MSPRRFALFSALLIAITAACGSGPASSRQSTLPGIEPAPAGLDFVADYSRWLWHKRRLTIQTTNHLDEPVEVTSIALRTAHFEDLPLEKKSTTIAPGARVDVQVDFGKLVSCTDAPVGPATVVMGLRIGDETTATDHVAVLDPTPLDVIRDRECAKLRVTDAADIGFSTDRTIDDDVSPAVMHTALDVDRRLGDDPIVVQSLEGSVIIALQPELESPSERVAVLDPADSVVSVPVELFIARCEPHAVSQSTLTWVLSAFVSVGGAPPHKLALDVSDTMRAELQAMIDDCIAALPPEG